MKLKLQNGLVLEGTKEQIQFALEKLGDNIWHYSETKREFVSVSDMADEHLKNAILSHADKYLNSLRDLDLDDFYEELPDFTLLTLPDELQNLLNELENRQ